MGLNADVIRNTLHSDVYKNEVARDQYEAQQVGVQGVPFYVFNNKYAVSGAQSLILLKEVLEKVWI